MERYKLTFRLAGPVAWPVMPIMFDSLLAHRKVREQGFPVDGNYESVISHLPLRKIMVGEGDYMYAASQLMFSNIKPAASFFMNQANTYGRMLPIMNYDSDTMIALARKGMIQNGSGIWKTKRNEIPMMLADSAEVVFETDNIAEVMRLVGGISSIGKKSGIGFGQIIDIEGPTATDSPIIRPIPAKGISAADAAVFGSPTTGPGPIIVQRIKPAYWQPDDRYVAGYGMSSTNGHSPLTLQQLFFQEVYERRGVQYVPNPGRSVVQTENERFDCMICGQKYVGEVAFPHGDIFNQAAFGEYGLWKNLLTPYVCKYCESVARQMYFPVSAIVCWQGGYKYAIGDSPKGTEKRTIDLLGADHRVTMDDIADLMLEPPTAPFCITVGHHTKKKHSLPHGVVNYDRDRYYINCGSSLYLIDRSKLRDAVNQGLQWKTIEDVSLLMARGTLGRLFSKKKGAK